MESAQRALSTYGINWLIWGSSWIIVGHRVFYKYPINIALERNNNLHDRKLNMYSLTKKFWDNEECLNKILYFIRIEFYMYGKCSCCSRFHIMSYKRQSSGFNINKIKDPWWTKSSGTHKINNR